MDSHQSLQLVLKINRQRRSCGSDSKKVSEMNIPKKNNLQDGVCMAGGEDGTAGVAERGPSVQG